MAQMRAPVLRLDLRTRTLLLFTLLFTIAGAALFVWTLGYGIKKAQQRLSDELLAIAITTAAGINGDEHQALINDLSVPGGFPLADERYSRIVRWLAHVKESHGPITLDDGTTKAKISLYTYTQDDNGQLIFVGSAAAINDQDNAAQFRQLYDVEIQEMTDGLAHPAVKVDSPATDRWGTWVSGFAPIRNSEKQIVGAVGVDMREQVLAAVPGEVMRQLLPIYGGAYLIVLVMVLLLSHGISRSFSTLTRAAERVAEGDYSQDFSRNFSGRVQDETTTLAFAFQKMIDKVAAREQRLRQQVQDLKIEIDLSKQERQVAEITDTDYFRNLQVKARVLRSRASEHAAGLEQPGGETPAVSTPTERITAVNDR